MSLPRLPRATTGPAESPDTRIRFAQGLWARRNIDDDWDDDDSEGAAERFDPDVLDDDEPQPEPGDFWVEPDDEEA